MTTYTQIPMGPQPGLPLNPPQSFAIPPQPGVAMYSAPVAPQVKKERRTYKRTLYWFGFVEIILGIFSCLLCVISLALTQSDYSRSSPITHISAGLWCGIFLLFTGIMAVTLKRSSASRIHCNMAMSIFTAILMAVMFMISVTASAQSHASLSVIHILLSIIASAGLILCIVHAAFCCATTCCIRRYRGRVVYAPVQQQVHFMQLANGNFMMVPNQPMMGQGYPMNTPPYATSPVEIHPSTVVQPPKYEQESSEPTPPPYSPQEAPCTSHFPAANTNP